ncbi:hypothetical protein H4J72_16740, partial [Colwellia sp. BRX10-2]|nr:hypothetical protein [Colwellia sp. BRX10-2]
MSRKFAIALSLSFLLHIVLAAVLLMGDFDSEPKVAPKVVQVQTIQATIVDKSKIEAQVNKIKQKKLDDAQQLKDLEQQVASARVKRAKEEKRIKALERQRKKKLLCIEIGYTQTFTFLPDMWKGLGANINFSYTESEIERPSNVPGE